MGMDFQQINNIGDWNFTFKSMHFGDNEQVNGLELTFTLLIIITTMMIL